MALITWKNPVSGDWNVASNWSTDTVPTFADDVLISAPGAYTVTSSGVDEAENLIFNAPQAELVENAGSLSLAEGLSVNSGLASLNTANAIGAVTVTGDELAFGNAGASGAGTVSVTGGDCSRPRTKP